MLTLKQLREQRAQKLADIRKMTDLATAEKRDNTPAEHEQMDRLFTEERELKTQIATAERREANAAYLAEAEAEIQRSAGRQAPGIEPGASPGREDRAKPVEFEFRGNKVRFEPGTGAHRRCQPEYRARFLSYMTGLARGNAEERALQSDLDQAGGYIIAPEQFVAGLIKQVDDEVVIRNKARKFTTAAASLGAVSRKTKMSTFAWGAELAAPTADTALKFGKRQVTPHWAAGSILVSKDLLRNAIMDPEAIVQGEIARDAGELMENGYMTGTGADQPLGVFTAHADGISTGRDVQTGSTTSITADGLIDAKYKLKKVYRNKAEWLFHRDAIKIIMKLKDSQNRFIYQPSLVLGQPDTLLGLAIQESEFAPNTFTTGLYVGLLACWEHYWIADSLEMQIQRLVELNARTNQDEFIARIKTDGAPILEEAFVRCITN